MKRLLVAALCALGFASAYAEPLDHWNLGSGTMTDGEWTFNINRRDGDGILPGSLDVYGLQILACTEFPDHLTTLDFSKPVVYTEGTNKYAITNIRPYGGCLSDAAKANVEHLRLPNHGLGLRINDTFQNCVNLVSVEPFLPSDLVISRGIFDGCVKLASPLVYSGSSDFAEFWELFKNTAIPSADLSESTITMLDRECFSGCTALKTVKLPPTLKTLQGGIAPFNNCSALEMVEFNSVPNTLNVFSGCASLKEVRFCHCAPAGSIPAGIYSELNQEISTYLILDDDETDELAAWATLTDGGVIDGESTWAQAYAGSAALMAKRPLRRYTSKSVSLTAGTDGSFTADQPGTFIISRGDGDSLEGMVTVNYTIVGGSAMPDVHFEPLSGSATIPNGEKTGVIEVTPKYFGYIGTADLTLRLAEGDYEIIGGSDEATISLATEALRSVTIAKGDDAEASSGKVGTFVISRGNGDPVGGAVTVAYAVVGGTAESAIHFKELLGTATIPAGQRDGVIEVTPIYFGYVGTKTLTVKLAEGDYELVPGRDTATISVATKSLRSVSIAKGEDANEGTGVVGFFIVSRGENDEASAPLEVELSVGGAAIAGQTYRPIKPIVTIPAGERSAKVKVVPFDDPSVTSDSVVEASIRPGNYGIVGTGSASVTVVNGATYGGWKFVGEKGTSISDGTWTFTVSRRPNDKFDDGVYHLWVQGCTAYPTAPAALDFGKAFHNFYDGAYYMIRQLEMNFGGNTAAAAGVGSLVLPDDPGYKFSILGECFANCPNLTSITPFLPRSCDSLGRDTFSFLTALAETDLYFYGSDFGGYEGCWGMVQNDTSITNVDLSASTITALRRDCFKGCTSLKTVKLPPTIQAFGAPHNSDGMSDRSPFADVGGVKLIFTGGALPEMTCNDGNVAAIEFTAPVSALPDNAFYSYFNPYGKTLLTSITFVGEPPATIGENLFSGAMGGFVKESVTVYVPNYYRVQWREIADDKVLSKTTGGTWTSGTKQLIKAYGSGKSGFTLFLR